MARILTVGIATLDIVNTVDGYPNEDAEVRALAQEVRRGGNATNTAAVLSRLGHATAWAGVLAIEPDTGRVLKDLERFAIDTAPCLRVEGGKLPTSYITLNRHNGSRTIVHYRDLPEYGFEQFQTLDLAGFDWIHFEGRNVEETGRMLARAREARPELPLSLEMEKTREGIEELLGLPSLLLFSRHYSIARGFDQPEELLEWTAGKAPQAELVCAWGEAGAWGRDTAGHTHHVRAHPPKKLVETLGAGDTFNAGMIDAKLRNLPLPEALEAANRLAGRKCGLHGFYDLAPPKN
ncbi:PfkB family carbohydrate kinase [Endothiovibrio diazotrophicus]